MRSGGLKGGPCSLLLHITQFWEWFSDILVYGGSPKALTKGSYCCIHAGVELLHVSVCDNQWCEQMDLLQEVRKLC